MRIDSSDLIHRKRKKEDEAEWFYEDLEDLLELTPPKDVIFITGDWNPKVVTQIPGVRGRFGLGV